jgi:hypothetical protein
MAKARPRGRPLKFGRPSRVVALTLPDDVIRTLRAVDSDIGRAIVALTSPKAARQTRAAKRVIDLSRTETGEAIIVVDSSVLRQLPGCSLLPVAPDRALLALEPGQGPAELELFVIDRLAAREVSPDERAALRTLRRVLRRWRRDQRVKVYPRSIVVLDGAGM